MMNFNTNGNTSLACPPGREEAGHDQEEALLGIYYEICVLFSKNSRLRRYLLQSAVAEVLPEQRVRVCLKNISPGEKTVRILYSPKVQKSHYGNLMVCGSVWLCAVCASKISERRKNELTQGMNNFDGGLAMVTYTLRHFQKDLLSETINKLDGAYRLLTSGRWWQEFKKKWDIVGSVSNIEITWGQKNGWHPHKHVLYFFRSNLGPAEIEKIRQEISNRYLELLGKLGGSGLDHIAVLVNDAQTEKQKFAEYVAKWDKEPKKNPWGIEDELTKSLVKSGQIDHMSFWQIVEWMVRTGEYTPVLLIREYSKAMKGKRSIVFSSGLRDYLKIGQDKTDLEIAKEQEEDAYILAELEREVWKAIVRLGLRGKLLEIADSGDRGQILDFLSDLARKDDNLSALRLIFGKLG